MATILHDLSFVVIPFLQLEIGFNNQLFKDGINIKNNVLQKNCIELCLDRQNYFNSQLGRYYDISLADFRKTFYPHSNTPDYNLEENYDYIIKKLKISDISGDIVFVKDVSNNSSVGNIGKTVNILREISEGFATALGVSGANELRTDSYMKLIKLFGMKDNFANIRSKNHIKTKFTALNLNEVALEMASEYDRLNTGGNLGAETFNTSNNTWGVYNHYKDDKIYDDVAALFDISGIAHTTATDPYTANAVLDKAIQKKTVYFCFSIVIHDLEANHTVSTTTTTTTDTTTTTTTAENESVAGPIQFLLYFRCSHKGTRTMDDYLTPTAFNTNYMTDHTFTDISSSGFNITWVASSNSHDRVVKFRDFQIGIPGSVITSTSFDPTVLDTVENIYADVSANAWNPSNNDVSGVLLDLSHTAVGYNIDDWDISSTHLLSDLSSNTYHAVRTFSRIGNIRNAVEDISLALVTEGGKTKPDFKETRDASNNITYSDISTNPGNTLGDRLAFKVVKLDGNIAIKSITATYYDLEGGIHSHTSNDSGLSGLGPLQANPRITADYSFNQVVGGDWPLDISFVVQNIFDLTSAPYTFNITTGAMIFNSTDMSQNVNDTTGQTIYLNIKNITGAGVPVSYYNIDYSSNINPDLSSNSGNAIIYATDGSANYINTDVSLNGMDHANTLYDISCHLVKVGDTSSNTVMITAYTRPGILRNQDVIQDLNLTEKNKIYLQINNLGNAPDISGGMYDISGYTVKFQDFSGNDASNNVVYDLSEQRVFADTSFNTTQNLPVTDQSATALDVPFLVSQSNFAYDISVNIWSKIIDLSIGNFIEDLSGAYMKKTFYSRPEKPEFVFNKGAPFHPHPDDKTGNASTDYPKIRFDVSHNNVKNGIDISGYTIINSGRDISNGAIIGTRDTYTETLIHVDVSSSDMSGIVYDLSVSQVDPSNVYLQANVIYDLSVSIWNVADLSSAYFDVSGVTRPHNFRTSDMSQNVVSSTTSSIYLNVNHDNSANTLDISGYTIDVSGTNGANASLQTVLVSATNAGCDSHNSDISINDLSANTRYDLSVNLFNIHDLSNAKMDISGSTRPSDFSANDISQNESATTAVNLILNVNNSQIADTLDMKRYDITWTTSLGATGEQTVSPSAVDLINNDGTSHARDRGDLSKTIDGNYATQSYVTSGSTSSAHAPFILAFDIPAGIVGEKLKQVTFKWGTGETGTLSAKFGYRRSNANSSLNMTSASNIGTGTATTGLLTWNNDTDWHIESAVENDDATINFDQSLILATGDQILVRWTCSNGNKHFNLYELKLHSCCCNTDSASVNKIPNNTGPTEINTDVSILDLSSNRLYDIELYSTNTMDISSATYSDVSGVTRPSDFIATDISQNLTDTTATKLIMKIYNSQDISSLDISGYEIDVSGNNGTNASLQIVIKVPTNKGPTDTNNDVSLNDLSANTTYDLSVNIIGKYRDLSNAELDISGTTRPSDFVANDISQNLNNVTSSKIVMKIFNSQIAGSLDISGYEIDVSGTNGANASLQTIIKTATLKSPDATNNDVSLNDLSDNTVYDLSVNLIGSIHDLSNAEFDISGVTRPSDFIATDISQNETDTTATKLIMKIFNSQGVGSLDISGYTVDVSGNNGANASLQTVIKVPINKGPTDTNNDVSLNDLSANTVYDLSVNIVGYYRDLSNAELDISGVTRPSDFITTDISQNETDTTATKLIMKIFNSQDVGSLDISGYTVDVSGNNGANASLQTIVKIPTNKGPTDTNNDVSFNDLSDNTVYDLSVNIVGYYRDLSNAELDVSGVTRPSDFANPDISQNLTDTTAIKLIMKIFNSQGVGSLDISGYEIDVSGNNGANASLQTVIKVPTNKGPTDTNNDVSLNDLSANTTYDLSVNIVGYYRDLSNAEFDISGTTRPSDFVANDMSQNETTTTATKLVMKIDNSQIAGSLDISGYEIDVSGNNGANASLQTITKTATLKSPDATNNDVSLNDLSDNTVYDLSVNLIGSIHDLSNAKFDISGVTRPSDFVANDISQNLTDTTAIKLIMKIFNSQGVGSLDISGYEIDVSGNNGTNASLQTIVKIPTIKGPTDTNNDVSLNDLSANTTYDLSINITGYYRDLSNAEFDISGTTRPSDFVANDMSQNETTTTATKLVMKIDNSQIAESLDISGYEIDVSGNNGANASLQTITKTATLKSPDATNNDVSLNDLSDNTVYDLSVNLIGSVHDLSNAKFDISGVTRPSDFVANDISQNLTDTTAIKLIMKIFNSQGVGSLDISGYNIDVSGNNGANASLQNVIKIPTNKGPTNTNNDVSLNDLSANTTYDLSVNIVGYYRDLSNAEFDISGTTRPSDFVANDMSQNETTTTATKLVMKIDNSQIAESLDISGYEIDVSGNNGANASLQTITKTATLKSPDATNNDVSLNDLSANTVYDLSVNLIGSVHDLSNAEFDISGVTRPSDFAVADISQNETDTTAIKLVMKIDNSQIAGSLDISGYEIDVSGNNGANASLQTVIKVPTNALAEATNNDVSLNDLSANTVYDLSVNLIGYYRDLSNAELDISGVTRPSDFATTDISQNETDTTATKLIMKIDNSQIAGSLDISGYEIDVSGNNGANASLQTVIKVPTNALAEATNNDVSLNDLSANTVYDLSVNLIGYYRDLSNAELDISGVTRPSDFAVADISQNETDTTAIKLVMKIDNSQIAGSLDISGYEIDVSGNNGANASLQTVIKVPTNALAEATNNDVSLNDLSANTVYDLSVNLIGYYKDLSNAELDISGVTRPSDFVVADISQNETDTTATKLIMKIDNSQIAGSLDISGYEIDVSGNNGANASLQTIIKIPTNALAEATNNDVSLNDLSANTVYDLSVNLIGYYRDLSNAELDISGVTRPSDFAVADISQNINDTSSNALVMKIFNSQGVGSLDISGYSIDISGNNGANASLQTIIHVPTNKGPTETNNDVSLNDLSANTMYDLSVNIIGYYRDLSNAELDVSGTTRPTNFLTDGTDVSQNYGTSYSDVSINQIIMSVIHKDVAGSLDISGYTIEYSVNGSNNDTGTIIKTTTNKGADSSNNDILLNNLNYPNSVYDMSVCLFNIYDMSNSYIDISGLTKPTDFATIDVSQNIGDTSSNAIVLNINSSQDQNSVNIKSYVIDFSGNNGTNSSAATRTLTPTTATAHSTNTDVTLTDLSANTMYDLSAHLINLYDMSNSELDLSGTTRPTDFVATDISQNIGETTTTKLVMKVFHHQIAGSLDISGYTFDVSGSNGANASLQTIVKDAVIETAEGTNNDVSLNDLSANTRYDLSVNQFNIYDMSNAKIAEYAITRPTDFVAADISQNIGDTTATKLVMKVFHHQVAGSLDISGYTFDVSGNNGANASLQTIVKDAVIETAEGTNNDVSLNDLSANTRYDLSVNQFNIYDMSNAKIAEYAVTRPSDFVAADISQNIGDTTTTKLVMKVFHHQIAGSLDISGYTFDVSGSNGANATLQTIVKDAVIETAEGTNNDVSLNDLSANTRYDLSVNQFNIYDMSNAKIAEYAITRPSDFVAADVSQNINDTTSSILMMNVNNSQLTGTLDISSYKIDISGTNGANASFQTITITPTDKTADSINTDVSLNDLSANTYYDLSANIVGKYHDLSNATITSSGTTRPTDFLTDGTDVSQNYGTSYSDVSINQIIMSVIHKDVATSLDISGYTIKYSVNGSNSDTGTIIKTTTNKSAASSNDDISLNDLNHPNAVYDMSVCLFNTNDMSNTFIDISGLTRPRNFITNDVSNNAADTTATTVVINVNNRQDANTVDISAVIITPQSGSIISKALTDSASNAVNRDISFAVSDLSGQANNTVNFDVHLVNIYDMSNTKVTLSGINIRPSNFIAADISQNTGDTTATKLVMKINHHQIVDTLDISGYEIDISGNNGANASLQTIVKDATNEASEATNNDVSLNDLSANTMYDLSINLFNVNDVSNSKLDVSGVTRPTDFIAADISQNIGDTTATKLVLKVFHHQVVGTLDISGYTFDVSGTNGANATLQTIVKDATDEAAEATNNDVSLNDLSANTRYDLSVNQFNIYDMSNAKIAEYAVTRPTNFIAADISQNIGETTATKLVMKVFHHQIAGSLDISGYTFDVSGSNGANASLQTIVKDAVIETAEGTNNDVSLNDLSANTRYDLSVNQFNIYDMSNAKIAEYAITRPTDFVAADISQNIGDTTATKLVMKVYHHQVAGSLDISGYTFDVSGNNGANASLQTIVKDAVIETAEGTNNDVSLNDLSANTRYDLSVNQFNIYDMSNAKIAEYAVTRPTNFIAADISQNIGETTTTKLVMKVFHHQIAGSLDISGYTFDVSGSNGANASLQTIVKDAVIETAEGTNNDVSLNDLSANTRYDLSVNQFNIYDMSNAKIAEYAITRPTDFVAADISQNIGDTTATKLVMKVYHHQVAGSLDISGYTFDVSGNNGANASLQTIVKDAVIETAEGTNNDVSLNDLSANTRYDLSVNQFNIYDMSNAKIAEYAVTRPTNFIAADISQNLTDTTATKLVMKVFHHQVAGSLDISGYTFDVSGNNGANASLQTIVKDATDEAAEATNNDVSLNDLSANTTYDLSVNQFNIYDLSNAKIAETATTRPSDFVASDVSQNMLDSSANTIMLNVINSQIAGTLDISGYEVDYSGNNSATTTTGTITKTAINKGPDSSNNDVSLNDLSANTMYDLSINLIGSVHDLSNSILALQGATAPTPFTASDVTQNDGSDYSDNQVILTVQHKDVVGTLDMSAITILFSGDISGTEHTDTITKIPENVGPNASNNDVSLNDLSGNMKYDLSINLVNTQNIDGDKIGLSVYTRPVAITNANVSQNVTDSSSNAIVFNWTKGQLQGTADISGFIFDISGYKSNGTFYDGGIVYKSASNTDASGSLTDISINNLVANTRYDFSANQFNIHDMSQVNMLDISGTTKPTTSTTTDVSQNISSYSSSSAVLEINNNQPALSLDISGYYLTYNNGLSLSTPTLTTPDKYAPFNTGTEGNNWPGKCGGVSYSFTANGHDGTGSYLPGSGNAVPQICFNIGATTGNNAFNHDTQSLSFWYYIPNDSTNSTTYPMFHIQDPSGFSVQVFAQIAIINDLKIYGKNDNNISKLYIDGVEKTLPSYNSNNGTTATSLSPAISHTTLRGWHHYYVEFGNDLPEAGDNKQILCLLLHDNSTGAPTTAGIDELKIYTTTLSSSEINQINYTPVNSGTKSHIDATNGGPTESNSYTLTALFANSKYDCSFNILNVNDISNENLDIVLLTKPTDIVSNDVSQNLTDTTSNILMMNVNLGQTQTTLDISEIIIDFSGNNGTNSSTGTMIVKPTTATAHSVNTDVSLNDLSANTTYDLSAHILNIQDMSNSKIAATGTTRPSDFVMNDMSQNETDLSINRIILKIYNSQIAGTLDISGYEIDVSGNNGANASLQTVIKTATLKGPAATNNDVSLNDLSSNTLYDFSVNLIGSVNDLSNAEFDISGVTKPTDFVAADISQNLTDTTATKLVMKIHNSQIADTLDISGYTVDISGTNGDNASLQTVLKVPTNVAANATNNDVSLNDLSANTTYDLSVNLVSKYRDLSNAKIAETATTRPSDFSAGNVSQTATYATDTILLTVANSQVAGTLDIGGYNTRSKIVGTSDISYVVHTATNNGPTASNTDVSIGDLSANYAYDLSLSLFNTVSDLSNNYIGIIGFTNPSNFVSLDVSQNILTATTTTVALKIDNSQISGSADISGYDVDISAGSGWITNRALDSATNTGATESNSITISSLAANTLYDVSVNMFNTHGYSNSKIQKQIHTTPGDFGTSDISQVLHSSGNDYANVATDSIKITITNPNVGTTIHDISGYLYEYSLNGGNADTGSGEHAAVNGGKGETNADLIIDSLNYPNGAYDISFQAIGSFATGNDLSGNKQMEIMYTKPSDFSNNDISQNVATTTTSAVGVFVNNSQHANTAAISKYLFEVTSSGHTPSYEITPSDTTSDGNSSVVVGTLTGLSTNKTYSLNYLYLRNEHDLSNNKLTTGSFTTLPAAPTVDISATENTTTTVNFDVSNNNTSGSLAISTYKITHSPTANESQPVSKTPANTTAQAEDVGVTLSDLSANRTYTITAVNVNSAGMESAASNSITSTTLPVAPVLSAASTENTLTAVRFDITNNNENGSLAMKNEVTYTPTGGSSTTVDKNASAAADAANVLTTISSLTANTTYAITSINTNTASKSSAASGSINESTLPAAPTIAASTTVNTKTTANLLISNNNTASTLDIDNYKIFLGGVEHKTQAAGATASNATNTDTAISDLSANTTYTITVANENSEGKLSAVSSSRNETTFPNKPVLSTSSTASTLTSVNFDVANSNPAGSLAIGTYKVYVGGALNSSPTPSNTAANATGVDVPISSGIAANTTYSVTCVNVGTGGDSAASDAISLTSLPTAPTIATTATNSTSGFTFTSANGNVGGTLTIDGYKVSHTPLGGSATITSKTPTNTTADAAAQNVVLTSLIANTQYSITNVNTNSGSLDSASSNSITMYTLPNAPVISFNDISSNSSLTFTVDNNNPNGSMAIATYKTNVDGANGADKTPTQTAADATNSSFTIDGLSANTSYAIKIAQFAQSGNDSIYSNTITRTTPNE